MVLFLVRIVREMQILLLFCLTENPLVQRARLILQNLGHIFAQILGLAHNESGL